MERESIEEGLLPTSSSLLNGQNHGLNGTIYSGGGDGDNSHGMPKSEPSSSVTLVLVLSTFVAVCASFTYGCDVGYSSPAESGIIADLGLSSTEYSVFSSILTIGAMVGAVTSGKMADFMG